MCPLWSVSASTYRRERGVRTQIRVTVRHPPTLSTTLTYNEHSRTEFTADDDEHLCRYIAEVLPDKGEGGRTGHLIYLDLIRRVSTVYHDFPGFHFLSGK
jgi:hypothetical protein